MLKCVIFDMDGVLIDSHPIHKRAWERFLLSVNRPTAPEELDFVLDGRKREEILRHFLGDISEAEVIDYGQRKEQFFRDEARNVETTCGIAAFLEELRDERVPVAISSCGSASRVNFMLKKLKMDALFSVVVTGDDVTYGKPDPDIFKKAADRLQISYESALVIEDAVSGVLAAKAAGMKCLAIANNGRGEALRSAGADAIAPDFQSVTLSTVRQLF